MQPASGALLATGFRASHEPGAGPFVAGLAVGAPGRPGGGQARQPPDPHPGV